VNFIHIHKFHIEKVYTNIIIYLFLGFVLLSFIALFGVVTFWDIAGINLVIAYIIGLVIIVVVIIGMEADLMIRLDIKYVPIKVVNKPRIPAGILTDWYLVICSVHCPFCNTYIEINHTNMARIPKYNERYPVCMHFRGLKFYGDEPTYVKFVNPKDVKS
jgi:hypothetical protein